jgi:hypothetical protein
MATHDDDVIYKNLIRQARPPGAGSPRLQSSAGRIGNGASATTTRIDEDGKVRRLWTPGDPWGDGTPGSSDFYFGGGEE